MSFLFLLENSLTPCIIPALLQIGCPEPLVLQQTHIARPPGQVERPGEESDIGCWGGKRLFPGLWRLRCWQAMSMWSSVCFHRSPLEIPADSTRCLCVSGAGTGSAFTGQIHHMADGSRMVLLLAGEDAFLFLLTTHSPQNQEAEGATSVIFFNANFPFFFACLSKPSTKPRALYVFRE